MALRLKVQKFAVWRKWSNPKTILEWISYMKYFHSYSPLLLQMQYTEKVKYSRIRQKCSMPFDLTLEGKHGLSSQTALNNQEYLNIQASFNYLNMLDISNALERQIRCFGCDDIFSVPIATTNTSMQLVRKRNWNLARWMSNKQLEKDWDSFCSTFGSEVYFCGH